jgi:hypothetical protein
LAMDALHVVLIRRGKWWRIGSNKHEIHQHHVNCEHNEMFAFIKCNFFEYDAQNELMI